MSIFEILLIGIGLSMDAFAVAVCKGLNMRKLNIAHALVIALFFGAFQALMPTLGYFLGRQFAESIYAFDHWIAFGLLLVIGGKMVWEALHNQELTEPEEEQGDKLDIRELLLMAVATSIDALAVGISFAFLNVNILLSASFIGCTTFVIALGGVVVGNFFGTRFKTKAEIAGGVILILIGLKILLNHLGILPF